MSSRLMIDDKASMDKLNPFVNTPPGTRRTPYTTEQVREAIEAGGGGLSASEPSPLCDFGVGGSDLRIGSPCDVPDSNFGVITPRLFIDEEILDASEKVGSERPRTTTTTTTTLSTTSGYARRSDKSSTMPPTQITVVALVALAVVLYIFRRR